MKSFPSTAAEAQAMYGGGAYGSYNEMFDVERIKALRLNTSLPVIEQLLKPNNINASNFQRYPAMSQLRNNGVDDYAQVDQGISKPKIFYENPLELPASAIALAKDYDWIYKYQVNSLVSSEKSGESLKTTISSSAIVPSMFNPMFGISARGLLRNTPLLNDYSPNEYDSDIDDCSIRTLCTMSKDPNSPIGMHRYKYADFMYCKDLGKVSNNHLITLRKFAHPIPDHIGRGTTPQYLDNESDWQWEIEGDVGRLISWFGTDDNKLEDIAKYSYGATWKELQAEIEEKDTNADNTNTGILGMISNGLNLNYNKGVNAGSVGNHSIFTWLGSKIYPNVTQGIGANNIMLTNYDNYKVYTPKNTMQTNNIYEGKLEFTHEFTLNFSYELRAYDNINPRSAFLDLLGNILEVTYRRGKFWGGSRKIIGPAQDTSMFNKVHHFIDGTVDKIPGWLASVAEGGLHFDKILGMIGSAASDLIGEAQNAASKIVVDGANIPSKLASWVGTLNERTGFTEALKGMLKNSLGRVQAYAWHSLVSGDDVGLWHLTVGNPKAPILSIGNLIMTKAEIQHYGPLGIDDFPTQLKVTVSLKHPRPRDITDIGRMYTGGTNALYHVLSGHKIEDFFSGTRGTYTTVDNAKRIKDRAKKDNIDEQVAAQKIKDEDLAKWRTEFTNQKNEETKKYQGVGHEYKMDLGENKLPNPLIYTEDQLSMMRMNTWSKAVFSVMMQEVA